MNHSIRLRDPWSLLPTTSTEAAFPARPTTSFTFSRKFNAPTGLAPLQSVILELIPTPLAQRLAVQLNGQFIEPARDEPEPTNEYVGEYKVATEPSSDASSERERQSATVNTLNLELREHLQAFNVLLVTIETDSSQALPTPPQFHNFCEARLLL